MLPSWAAGFCRAALLCSSVIQILQKPLYRQGRVFFIPQGDADPSVSRDIQLLCRDPVGNALQYQLLAEEWYGCSDGTTTGYMKIKTDDIYKKLLPFANHSAAVIEV